MASQRVQAYCCCLFIIVWNRYQREMLSSYNRRHLAFFVDRLHLAFIVDHLHLVFIVDHLHLGFIVDHLHLGFIVAIASWIIIISSTAKRRRNPLFQETSLISLHQRLLDYSSHQGGSS